MMVLLAASMMFAAPKVEAQVVSVKEFWESPADIANDDNDLVAGNATIPIVAGGVIDAPGAGETLTRGLSGLQWGGYSAATGGAHPVQIRNIEGLLGPGTLSNSFLSFVGHSATAAADFPADYNANGARIGSYAYTRFSTQAGGVNSIDAQAGLFKIGVSADQGLNPELAVQFRFLIQVAGTQWFRSNPQSSDPTMNPNDNIPVALLLDPFGGANSNALTAEQRESLLMSVHAIGGMTWERVSAAAESNMNGSADGGEVELGAAQAGAPDLANVTGMGVSIDTLTTGDNLTGGPNDIDVIGLTIEGSPPEQLLFSFAQAEQMVTEGSGSTTFSADVTVSRAPAIDVTVDFAAIPGTALAGADYILDAGTLTFPAGQTGPQTIGGSIPNDNSLHEAMEETFTIQLSNPSSGALGAAVHTVRIIDDDPQPTMNIEGGPTAVNENAGTIARTVSLSNTSAFQVTADFTAGGGLARAGVDFSPGSGSVVFNPGETAMQIPIQIIDDNFHDTAAAETFTIALTDPVGATLGNSTHQITINDNDPAPTIDMQADPLSVDESSGSFTTSVTLSGFLEDELTAYIDAIDGTAARGVDYRFGGGQIVGRVAIPGQSLTGNLTVESIDDPFVEGPEDFTLVLAAASTGILPAFHPAIGDNMRTVTITDATDADVETVVFSENFEGATPGALAAGPLTGSELTALLTGDSAPIDHLRVASIPTRSNALQRFNFATGPVDFQFADPLHLAVGNTLEGTIDPPIDLDSVKSVTLEALVFIGGLTPTGDEAFPAGTAGDLLSAYSTFTFSVGNSGAPMLPQGVSPAIGGPFTFGFQINNFVEGDGGTRPRFHVAVNDSTAFGSLESFVATPSAVFTDTQGGAGATGPGSALQDFSVMPPAGREYMISATFEKLDPTQTMVSYSMTPVGGSGFASSGTLTLDGAFPSHRRVDAVAVNLGSGFGFGDGPGDIENEAAPAGDKLGRHAIPDADDNMLQGSWVDNLTVKTFGLKPAAPLSATHWTIYK
jgi:hypothetical protein